MSPDWCKKHPQHGDEIFRKVCFVQKEVKTDTEAIRTHFSAKGDLQNHHHHHHHQQQQQHHLQVTTMR